MKKTFPRPIALGIILCVWLLGGCIQPGSTQLKEESHSIRTNTRQAAVLPSQTQMPTQANPLQKTKDKLATEITQLEALQSQIPPTAPPSKTPTPTATETPPDVSEIEPLLEGLSEKGILHSSQGAYIPLEDFSDSLAKIFFIESYPTGYAPADFVFTGKVDWESDGNTPQLETSSCGIKFREKDKNHFYIATLNLDGTVDFNVFNGGRWVNVGYAFFDKRSFHKTASFTLIAEEDWVTILVDGEQMIRKQLQTIREGDLSYTISSGINTGFGTRCKISSPQLFILNQELPEIEVEHTPTPMNPSWETQTPEIPSDGLNI